MLSFGPGHRGLGRGGMEPMVRSDIFSHRMILYPRLFIKEFITDLFRELFFFFLLKCNDLK